MFDKLRRVSCVEIQEKKEFFVIFITPELHFINLFNCEIPSNFSCKKLVKKFAGNASRIQRMITHILSLLSMVG